MKLKEMEIAFKAAKKVQEILPDTEVEFQEILKNNGVTKNAVTVKSRSNCIGEVIYIDDLLAANFSVEGIAMRIVEIYKKNVNFGLKYETMDIASYAEAKKHFSLRLVNKKMNIKRLLSVPYKEFLDMAVIVVMNFLRGEDIVGSSIVDGRLLELWDVSFDEVYRAAFDNFIKEETVIESMAQIFSKMGICDPSFADDIPLFILTNKNCTNGATHLLKTNIIERFAAERLSDILVLPSSIHEAILLPCIESVDMNELTRIVKSVNEKEVIPEEVLSDHVYLYRQGIGWCDWH